MQAGFLGLGQMGSAIAGHILQKLAAEAGSLAVWNRTAERAERLRQQGARVAATPAEAATGSEVLFTMLMDDSAIEAGVIEAGVLDILPRGAVHVVLSTISVALSGRLAFEHAQRGQYYVAAPVFGRPSVAEDGKLWTTVAGAGEQIDRIRPMLESFSRGITVVGEEAASAHALKLGGNFLITAMIAALSEGLIYADANRIEPAVYMEAVNHALFRSPFYEAYGRVMLAPPEKPGATIALGQKDTRLFREAAEAAGVRTPLADEFQQQLQRAAAAGLGGRDWAAGYYEFAKSTSRAVRQKTAQAPDK